MCQFVTEIVNSVSQSDRQVIQTSSVHGIINSLIHLFIYLDNCNIVLEAGRLAVALVRYNRLNLSCTNKLTFIALEWLELKKKI